MPVNRRLARKKGKGGVGISSSDYVIGPGEGVVVAQIKQTKKKERRGEHGDVIFGVRRVFLCGRPVFPVFVVSQPNLGDRLCHFMDRRRRASLCMA
jgi:hypothetical protein